MLSPLLRSLGDVPASVLFLLTAMATQRSVAYAQSQGGNNFSYYWFSPGRIVGIAVGVVVLVLIILSMLIFACRRRRHIRASKVMVSNYSGGGGQPQAYSSWQRAQQPSYGPHAPEPGWYHPAPGTAPFDRAKTTEAQRTAASEQMPRTAAFGEGQSVPPSNQVQRPAPSVQAQITAFPGQAQRIAPSGQVQSAASPGQASLPSGQAQSAASSAQAQEQGAPPRYARTKDTNGREQNPPPYSPPAGPSTPSAARTAR